MDSIKFNKEQLNAIENKGSSLLVSAAAGSGKTAVLVERIIRKIIAKSTSITLFKYVYIFTSMLQISTYFFPT